MRLPWKHRALRTTKCHQNVSKQIPDKVAIFIKVLNGSYRQLRKVLNPPKQYPPPRFQRVKLKIAKIFQFFFQIPFTCPRHYAHTLLIFYFDVTFTISLLYSTLNKIIQFSLVESSTINPKLHSVGVPIDTNREDKHCIPTHFFLCHLTFQGWHLAMLRPIKKATLSA